MTASDLSDPQSFVKTFKEAEAEEIEAMKKLRLKKSETSTSEDEESGERKKDNGTAIECELCRKKFNPSFVPLQRQVPPPVPPNKPTVSQQSSSTANVQTTVKPNSLREIKFLCPSCVRSRRPRLETILSLLVALQKLSVRLPEGDALQCLTERAMEWQAKARESLIVNEVAAALKKINSEEKSSAKKNQQDESGGGPRESPVPPKVDISAKTVDNLESLLLQGDLLEISLDEVQHLWKVLQVRISL